MDDANNATTIADAFSREKVKSAVNAKMFSLPAMLSSACGGAGLLAWLVLDPTMISPIITLLVMGLGFSTGIGATLFKLLRRGALERAYIEMMRAQLQEQRRRIREKVQADLAQIAGEIAGMEDVAKQGTEQMALAKAKNEILQSLLEQKLSAGELTFARFMGTSEQLYLSVLDNVRRVVDHLRSISTIKSDRIERRIKEIERLKSPSDDEIREKAALEAQRDERAEQVKRIDKLMRENEEILAQLDKTSSTVAAMETGQGREATTDLEHAMEDLRSLIKRTSGK